MNKAILSTCRMDGWMDAFPGLLTWLHPSQGDVPAVDWIPDTRSIALSDGGMPQGIGLRSDSLQEDWHEYYYGPCIRLIMWLTVDRFCCRYLYCFVCWRKEDYKMTMVCRLSSRSAYQTLQVA
jgi:hypothetical protein